MFVKRTLERGTSNFPRLGVRTVRTAMIEMTEYTFRYGKTSITKRCPVHEEPLSYDKVQYDFQTNSLEFYNEQGQVIKVLNVKEWNNV